VEGGVTASKDVSFKERKNAWKGNSARKKRRGRKSDWGHSQLRNLITNSGRRRGRILLLEVMESVKGEEKHHQSVCLG